MLKVGVNEYSGELQKDNLAVQGRDEEASDAARRSMET
jgi:hypothetical protein